MFINPLVELEAIVKLDHQMFINPVLRQIAFTSNSTVDIFINK